MFGSSSDKPPVSSTSPLVIPLPLITAQQAGRKSLQVEVGVPASAPPASPAHGRRAAPSPSSNTTSQRDSGSSGGADRASNSAMRVSTDRLSPSIRSSPSNPLSSRGTSGSGAKTPTPTSDARASIISTPVGGDRNSTGGLRGGANGLVPNRSLGRSASGRTSLGSLIGGGSQPSNYSATAAAAKSTARVSSFNNSRGVASVLTSSAPPNVNLPSMPMNSNRASAGRLGAIANSPLQEKEVILPGDVVVGYGSSSIQGMRDYQEDTVGFLSQQSSGCLLGGVFDGHGGDFVSKELEKNLLQTIMRGINATLARNADYSGSGDGPSTASISAAIATSFVQVNADISRLSSANETGSCAVAFAMVKSGSQLHLFVANAGDCRAVLCTGPPHQRRAVRLSEDHKPHPQVNPGEISRVTQAGGCVLWGRVQGCLAVSRAFGDKSLQPYVIADPYISYRPISPDQDAFFYLCSDGVTDIIEDNVGCGIVEEHLNKGHSTSQAAAALVSAAYQQGSMDNISAVVVRLGTKRR